MELSEFIRECSKLNVRCAQSLAKKNLDFLIWAAPTASREAEDTIRWQPYYLKKKIWLKWIYFFSTLFVYAIVGFWRFFSYKGFHYEILKTGSKALLILPVEVTQGRHPQGRPPQERNPYKTSYMIESAGMSPAAKIDKLIFSRTEPLGVRRYELTVYKRIRIFMVLFFTLLGDFFTRILKKETHEAYLDSFVILFQWIIAQKWFFHWDFYHFLRNLCLSGDGNYKVLVSVHEMSFYTKMIWQVSKEAGLLGVTAQHAMIYPEKLNFFPEKNEIEAGIPQPHIFFVYSPQMVTLLKPYFPKTRFLLGCSPRFNRWRDQKSLLRENGDVKNLLFVSGVMFYDVMLLLTAIKKLMKENRYKNFRFWVRFHPDGEMRIFDKVSVFLAHKLGKIEISRGPLEETLKHTSLVVGSNTTTLQEAMLLGIPTLNIFHEDFLCADVLSLSKDLRIHVNDISSDDVSERMKTTADPKLIEDYKAFMGLYHPDFSTDLLYRVCEL